MPRPERVIDYRSEVDGPDVCPVCGAAITKHAERGRLQIGPGDLTWAKKHGITTEGPVTTIWTRWECSRNPDHESGPIILA